MTVKLILKRCEEMSLKETSSHLLKIQSNIDEGSILFRDLKNILDFLHNGIITDSPYNHHLNKMAIKFIKNGELKETILKQFN